MSCTAEGLRARCVNLHGGIIAETSTDPVAGVVSPESIVETVAQLIARTPRVLGIGVAVPGVVDAETGDVSAAPDLGWTTEVPLRTMLRERFGVVVTIDNDVNLMMASERRTLDGRAARNAVYLYLGARGIEKLSRTITAWPERGDIGAALARMAVLMERGGTGAALFRNLYRDFLGESLALLDDPRLETAYGQFQQIAAGWTAVAGLIGRAAQGAPAIALAEAAAILRDLASAERSALEALAQL